MSKLSTRSRTTGLIAAALVAGSLITWSLISGAGEGEQSAAQGGNDQAAIEQARSLSRAFRSASREVLPTVVKVKTITTPRRVGGESTLDNPFRGTPCEDYFDEQVPGFRWRQIPDVPQPGLGSGVIIDPSGIVLTNNHVVEGADQVFVQLGDGRQFEVTDIKTDAESDLAVLRIKADESLPAAQLGDSDQLEIGDWVIAIGNPFELQQTVSAGIISGKARTLPDVRRARFLQTDAAINPGNSGGPLVDLDGRVVGINTAIFSRTGGYNGIGFAIPSNLAKWVTKQLIEQGTVSRAYMGVVISNISPEVAEKLDVLPNSGVVVERIGEGSPAEKAGVRKDDVIVAFDGRQVGTASDLQELVEQSPADSRHQLRILRDGKLQTLRVQVQAMPEDAELSLLPEPSDRAGSVAYYNDGELGLGVIELTDYWAEQSGYEGRSGVLVYHVDRDKIAAQAGLREGMLIVRVGEKPVKSVAEFKEAMQDQSLAKGITLELQTRQGRQTVTLQSS
jgi:serine protease Do